MAENLAIIAAAGALKTETVIERALAEPERRVLITTYTKENLAQIIRRIEARCGVVPVNLAVMTWFSFLLSEAVRPYQHTVLDRIDVVGGLNFLAQRNRFTPKNEPDRYYLDASGDLYRNGVSEFACRADRESGGRVIARLEQRFDCIYVDEVQDLVGYDLDFLDLLFASQLEVTVVGDPRQFTLATNTSLRNKKYRGPGLLKWLDERTELCVREDRTRSARCSQPICDFAAGLFPQFGPIESDCDPGHGADGIHCLRVGDVKAYMDAYDPVILRERRTTNTHGLDAINIGVAKGSTYDRVLIFPSRPMRKYLEDGDLGVLKAPQKLYVAVTRARFSVGFVV